VLTVTLAALTATVGVVCLAAGLHQYFFFGPTRWWERVMLLAAALVLIKPGWVTDLIGLGLLAATVASQLMIARPAKVDSATAAESAVAARAAGAAVPGKEPF